MVERLCQAKRVRSGSDAKNFQNQIEKNSVRVWSMDSGQTLQLALRGAVCVRPCRASANWHVAHRKNKFANTFAILPSAISCHLLILEDLLIPVRVLLCVLCLLKARCKCASSCLEQNEYLKFSFRRFHELPYLRTQEFWILTRIMICFLISLTLCWSFHNAKSFE